MPKYQGDEIDVRLDEIAALGDAWMSFRQKKMIPYSTRKAMVSLAHEISILAQKEAEQENLIESLNPEL